MSLGFGSSTDASCCVARKIFLSPAKASSRARTEDSRPTMNGVIICGKITISRTGIIGTRFNSSLSLLNIRLESVPKGRPALSRFLEQAPVDFAAADHFRGDEKLARLSLARRVVHEVEHQVLENHAQAARSHFALHGFFGHGLERVVGKAQPDVL